MAAKKRTTSSGDLLIESTGQLRIADKSVEQRALEKKVECLGMTFESEEARRTYFIEKLREKLNDPEFRKIEGFPLGSDEDILALSDPPYYTACPNPFVEQFVHTSEKADDSTEIYARSPFAVDISEGKNDPLYKAHGYHTKVPHLAIVPSILHYTKPGDIVLDGFCGSGMTGVAAQWCDAPPDEYRRTLEALWKSEALDPPEWGLRRVVLNDLSPAATFIAAGYNLPFDVDSFNVAAHSLLEQLRTEHGWMYATLHEDGATGGEINYTVWSDVFACSECGGEIVFTEEALDEQTKRVKSQFSCPHCDATVSKRSLDRLYETRFDSAMSTTIKVPKRKPTLIDYTVAERTHQKIPTREDVARSEKISSAPLPNDMPTWELPYMHMTHERARMDLAGITHVHHFFTPRSANALVALWRGARLEKNADTRRMLLWMVEQAVWGMSLLARYAPTHYSQVNQHLSGVYYIASQVVEVSPWYILDGKVTRLVKAFQRSHVRKGAAFITVGDCRRLPLPSEVVDYIFTDPPFGENIYYSDLNLLVEAWHRVRTDPTPEAIIDRAKKKGLHEYQDLMRRCFAEYHRVLKAGRWITVVFHNSRNAVWNAIQEALRSAGFVVADVRTLDKQQGSYRQMTSTAAKQDLVISAYKPNGGLEQHFTTKAESPESAWDFVRQHLRHLAVFVQAKNVAEVIRERQPYMLYDRMVAFYVQRGAIVPISAAEFYAGLKQRFPERDGMYFLPHQAAEYDKRRLQVAEVSQLEFFVNDERSALEWLRHELAGEPQTYQQIQPKFLRKLHQARHERLPELLDMLQENFLRDEQQRWYVPDPSKLGDIEKLRERSLLREFEEYKTSKQKSIKSFRTEAIRAGFKVAWADRNYETIVAIAQKLPEDVVQEDDVILMYYDNASMRLG